MPPPSPRAARPFLDAMTTAAAARPANASRPLQQVAAAVGAILKNATTPPPPKPPPPPATAASRFVTALIGQSACLERGLNAIHSSSKLMLFTLVLNYPLTNRNRCAQTSPVARCWRPPSSAA